MTNLPLNISTYIIRPRPEQSELETAFIPDKDTENDIQKKHIYTLIVVYKYNTFIFIEKYQKY